MVMFGCPVCAGQRGFGTGRLGVLGEQGCAACLSRSGAESQIHSSRCGAKSFADMLQRFEGGSAQILFDSLSTVVGPPGQVFDVI